MFIIYVKVLNKICRKKIYSGNKLDFFMIPHDFNTHTIMLNSILHTVRTLGTYIVLRQ